MSAKPIPPRGSSKRSRAAEVHNLSEKVGLHFFFKRRAPNFIKCSLNAEEYHITNKARGLHKNPKTKLSES